MDAAPPHDPRLIPVLVAVGYVACVIALWGLLSLALNIDAVTEADAGPLLGPAMAITAGAIVAIALWRLRRQRSVVLPAVGTTAIAYLAMLVVGGLGYGFTRSDAVAAMLFVARYAISPFIGGAAVLAGLSVLFLWAVTVRDRRSPHI